MKVSEITPEFVINYLRNSVSNMTTAEIAEVTAMVDIAKTFIRSYTGIRERTIANEAVGTGDGETTEYCLLFPAIPGASAVYADGEELTAGTDYALDSTTGDIAFAVAPSYGVEITATYQTGLDAYNDFVIAVCVLVQGMYDTRAYYIDKASLNSVVETILNMHCINLL